MTEIFFGEVTIRICRSLEIEEELRSCMEYLSQHMPAESLYLKRYKGNLGAMHFVARATDMKGERMEMLPVLE